MTQRRSLTLPLFAAVVVTLLPLSRRLTLRAGGGIFRQEPGFAEQLGVRGAPGLAPQRAYHADAGIEGQFGTDGRWQMTVYDREDRDQPRLPETELRLVSVPPAPSALVNPSLTSRWTSAADGYARGIEWLVRQHSVNGWGCRRTPSACCSAPRASRSTTGRPARLARGPTTWPRSPHCGV